MMFGMMRGLRALTLAVAGGLLAGCGSSARQAPPPETPDRVDRFGDVEVFTHTHAARSANYDTWGRNQAWTLRWQGQPLEIESLGGMWLDRPVRIRDVHSAFVVGTAERPDILVLVGDPNNGSVFHRLSQDGGQLATPVVCKTFAGDNAVRVLDGKEAGTLFQGPNYRVLIGTPRLQLGSACVYDAARRQALVFPVKPDDVVFPYASGAPAVSPDGRYLARVGRLAVSGNPVMLVADFEAGRWTRRAIDPLRMRYHDFGAIDVAWVEHHFQWRPTGLVERAGFRPLPWQGRFHKGSAQYDIPQTEGDPSEFLGEFLVRHFQARRLPVAPGSPATLRYQVDGEVVNVWAMGFYVASTATPYQPGRPGDPNRQKALIRRIGEAFDAELAGGRHDAMFIDAPLVAP